MSLMGAGGLSKYFNKESSSAMLSFWVLGVLDGTTSFKYRLDTNLKVITLLMRLERLSMNRPQFTTLLYYLIMRQ